jgi:hypothetical protein
MNQVKVLKMNFEIETRFLIYHGDIEEVIRRYSEDFYRAPVGVNYLLEMENAVVIVSPEGKYPPYTHAISVIGNDGRYIRSIMEDFLFKTEIVAEEPSEEIRQDLHNDIRKSLEEQ